MLARTCLRGVHAGRGWPTNCPVAARPPKRSGLFSAGAGWGGAGGDTERLVAFLDERFSATPTVVEPMQGGGSCEIFSVDQGADR